MRVEKHFFPIKTLSVLSYTILTLSLSQSKSKIAKRNLTGFSILNKWSSTRGNDKTYKIIYRIFFSSAVIDECFNIIWKQNKYITSFSILEQNVPLEYI